MRRISPLLLVLSTLFAVQADAVKEIPEGVWVRPGYTLSVAIDQLEKPRFLAAAPNGTLFVSLPNVGEIKACRDQNNDGYYEAITTFISDHPTAHGLCWNDGWLWFSQTGAILKARDNDGDGKADEIVKVVNEGQIYSEGGGHWWRSVLIHNGKIYTSIGDQTNSTDEPIDASTRKKIWTFDLDGSNKELFATGLRNTEKFAVRPGTDEIWGVDHDIDNIAKPWEEKEPDWGQPITDVFPPAELNHYKKGEFYGHPFILGKKLPNPNYMTRPDIVELAAKTVAPELDLPAHCSGIGMAFYDADQFPNMRGDAFVAQRGSWNNKTEKVGYKIARILFEYGRPYGQQDFARFVTPDQKVLGRPVDVMVGLDGSLLFSDDTGNMVYRLTYTGE